MSGGSLSDTKINETVSAFEMFSLKQHLVDALRKRDIMLVLPELFFDQWKQRTRLPRRQDVPSKYILDVDLLSDEQLWTLEVIAVRYCWVDASHPDPQCYHLQTLNCLLHKFVAGILVVSKEYYSRSSNCKFTFYTWDRVFGSGDGRPVGLFLDWMSVHQQPRSAEEDEVFKRALRSINLWYAHSSTTTWMLTSLPPGVVRANYRDSGWTFERLVAGLISPAVQLLEIGADVRDELIADGFRDNDYYQLSLRTMPTVRGAPVDPEAFARDVKAKHFTNGADRDKVVIPRYEETFRAVMAAATKIDYDGLQLPEPDKQFREIYGRVSTAQRQGVH